MLCFLEFYPNRFKHGLHLYWTKYIQDLLRCTKIDRAKPLSNLSNASIKLTLHKGQTFIPSYINQWLVLYYITITRLNLSFMLGIDLITFSYANWASDLNYRCSTSRYCSYFFLMTIIPWVLNNGWSLSLARSLNIEVLFIP